MTAADVLAARDMGFVIKLLAVAELADDERGITVRVHPAMVPRTHPLASVREAFNAVFVEADAAGQVMFYGRGAGGAPTASAVLGDIVAAARNKVAGHRGPGESAYADLDVLGIEHARTRYYVNLRRGRPSRGPGHDRHRVRRPRRVDPGRQAGRPRRRGLPPACAPTWRPTPSLSATISTLRGPRCGPRRRRRDAGRGRGGILMAHQWRGVIEEYRSRLPVSDATPVVSPVRGRDAAGPCLRASAR